MHFGKASKTMADERPRRHSQPTISGGENHPAIAVSRETSGQSGDSPEKPELGWTAIARRITGWTSNLLVTFLILGAGLAFGVQVLIWWKEAPTDGNPSSDIKTTERQTNTEAWAEFRGVGGRFSWLTIQDDENAAIRRAQEICREAAQEATFPAGLPDLAEQDVLAKLGNLSPVCEGPHGVRVYRYPGDFPVWVGVKIVKEVVPRSELENNGNLASQGSRIVAWTFLIRGEQREWTIYRVSTDTGIGTQESTIVPNEADMLFPIPPGASVVSRFSPGSGAFFGIFQETSPGTSATWTLFLDRQLHTAGWKPLDNWSKEPLRQRRTFTRNTPSAEQSFLTIEIARKSGQPARGLVFGFRWTIPGHELKTEPASNQMRQGAG